jgi:hypothetical protein
VIGNRHLLYEPVPTPCEARPYVANTTITGPANEALYRFVIGRSAVDYRLYVDDTMHHETGKSGGMTYTTSGPYVSDMADFATLICWPETWYTPCGSPMKQIKLLNQTFVRGDAFGGDSGSPVFTGDPGSGAPYAALGILVGISDNIPNRFPTDPCPSCVLVFSRWSAIEARIGIGKLDPRTFIP